MPLSQIVIFSMLQGLTDFLPLPDDVHLILLNRILGWNKPEISLLIAMQAGALVAVICYYLADLIKIAYYMVEAVAKRREGPVAKIGICLVIASAPSIITILFTSQYIARNPIKPNIAGWISIFCGLLIAVSAYVDRHLVWRNIVKVEGERRDSLRHISWQQALFVGVAQALMVIPGASRSSMSFSAGLLLGLRTQAAARFSILLALPVIILSICIDASSMNLQSEIINFNIYELILAAGSTFIFSLFSIYLFVKYLGKFLLKSFVTLSILFGLAILFF